MGTLGFVVLGYLAGFVLTMGFLFVDVLGNVANGKGRLGDLLVVWLLRGGSMILLWPVALPMLIIGGLVLLVDKVMGRDVP